MNHFLINFLWYNLQQWISNNFFIDDTPYEGGVFRWTLRLDSDFPKSPPKGFFLTKIFHPNVAANGDIWVNTLKKDWNPAKWSLGHILGVIRCLLIIPFPESSLNEEAGRLFMDDYEEYARTAKMMTKIHAKPNKSALMTADTNENTSCNVNEDSEIMKEEEHKKELTSNNTKLKFNSNKLDTSMEAQDEENVKWFNQPEKSVLSGSSLFGAKSGPAIKKPKTKKKMRRI